MAKRLQHRGGTTAQHSTFTGAVREVTVDTDKNTLVVHDGATAGGHPLATATNFTSTGIDDNATSTAITIDSSQNVDVAGTITADGAQIDGTVTINGTGRISSNGSIVYTIDSDNTSTDAGHYFRSDAGINRFNVKENGDISFYEDTGTTPKFFWDASTERLGIGTSSPTDYIHIHNTADSTALIHFTNGATGSANGDGFKAGVTVGGDAYLRQREAANLLFYTSDAERMRIDSSGNVGIGTSSPNAKLDVRGSAIFNEAGSDVDFRVESDNNANMLFVDGGNDRIGIGTSSPSDLLHLYKSSNDSIMRIQWDADHAGKISFREGGTETGQIEMHSPTDTVQAGNMLIATLSSGAAGKAIVFQTNSSERMRIDSSGNVQIGNASTSGNGYNFTSSLKAYRNTTALQEQIEFYNPNGIVGTIKTDGTTTSYNTSSDYRLKENVNYDFDATSRLKQLKPARFNFIADADKTVDGFIAHEVQDIVPEAISGEKDAVNEDGSINPQGIDQSKLVPLLVKTIQELEARITALETQP